jgi:hypothetical protein
MAVVCIIASIFLLAAFGFAAGKYPFLIAKPREAHYTPGGAILAMDIFAAQLLVAGRIFGWW